MTVKELTRHIVSIAWKGYGQYKVTIEFRGKVYSCLSNNSMAYDRWKDVGYLSDRTARHGYTLKRALQCLYDECKMKNGVM